MKYKLSSGLRIASAILLLIATLSLPYSYYVILRWIVCVSAFITAYEIRKVGGGWLVFFITIGILFNPIAPIYLNRSIWLIIDIFTAGIFVYYREK